MDTDAIQKQIAVLKLAGEDNERDIHLAHIPIELHDNVIELTSVPLDYASCLTVMLGVVTPSYSTSMWQVDAANWSKKFPNSTVFDLQLKSARGSPNALDTADASDKIKAAFSVINLINDQSPLRIILLGPGYASFLPYTIKHMIKEWKTEDGEERKKKKLILVISNTTQVNKYFELCKELCLTGLCQAVQFYNTDYYYPFGYYNTENDTPK